MKTFVNTAFLQCLSGIVLTGVTDKYRRNISIHMPGADMGPFHPILMGKVAAFFKSFQRETPCVK